MKRTDVVASESRAAQAIAKGRDAIAAAAPFRLDAIEMRLLRLPLVEPFVTSFGRVETRLIFLVRMEAEGRCGYGEIVAFEEPLYSYETVATAREVIRAHFGPVLLGAPLEDLAAVAQRLNRFRGHPMARAGIELAFVDLVARLRGEPVAGLIDGVRERVAVGVSLGVQESIPALLDRVDVHLDLGYRRIKLKIKPGWDVDVVAAVRSRHPSILLSVDANAAYTLSDRDHLKRLDAYDLLMIEQPLRHDDLVDHADLQRTLRTDLCLDESLTSVRQVEQALDLGSCRIVNLKVGRVGGYSEALAIHDLCVDRGVPLWCGGMLESGIGRAHNLALASLAGFTLPGDISASRRYFARDIITPEVEVDRDGTIAIPRSAGLGFDLDAAFVERSTVGVERLTRD